MSFRFPETISEKQETKSRSKTEIESDEEEPIKLQSITACLPLSIVYCSLYANKEQTKSKPYFNRTALKLRTYNGKRHSIAHDTFAHDQLTVYGMYSTRLVF